MVKSERTGCWENMAAKGDRAKTLDRNALHRVGAMFENVNDLSKQQSAVNKYFASGSDTHRNEAPLRSFNYHINCITNTLITT